MIKKRQPKKERNTYRNYPNLVSRPKIILIKAHYILLSTKSIYTMITDKFEFKTHKYNNRIAHSYWILGIGEEKNKN